MIQNYVTMQAFVRMEVHVPSTTTVPKSANVPQDIQVSPSKSNPGICIDQILAENQKKNFFSPTGHQCEQKQPSSPCADHCKNNGKELSGKFT